MAQRKRKTKRQSNANTAAAGTPIRFEQPASQRKPKPKVARTVAKEVNPITGFTNFLREYTVVTLAVGFVIATQVQGLVRQLVADFVNPLSQLLFGTALSERTFTLHWHTRAANFAWGDLAYGLIDFLFVLLVIFLIIKIFQLDKLNKPKTKK
ncbi:MAG TPA: MscL family protein [Candidatus Saccharimonadales bacterium]|nr:MscL family protein [Candidatus Saccharimonadales bacterium]